MQQFEITEFTEDEKYIIIDRLSDRGVYLHALWNITKLVWTNQTPTAAVTLDGDNIIMLFNPDFWATLPDDSQLFVVCHEQLHIMSDHFRRLKFNEGDSSNKNKAADVAVNESLVRNFGFVREDFPNWYRYCWVDTIFPNSNISTNETAEYYYTLIINKLEKGEIPDVMTIDDHQYNSTNNNTSSVIREAINESKKQITQIGDKSHSKDLSDYTNQGTTIQEHQEYNNPSKSWNALYATIPKRILADRAESHWKSPARRNALLPSDLFLPGSHDVRVNDKVKVNVYLDTSGSCIEDAKYFLRSALTLPPTKFEVNMFGFCESVYPVDHTPPSYGLRGFGAESYPAVVDHVNDWGNLDAIFVFTDGHSPFISPPNPQKWHWFITPGGIRSSIDSRCKVYNLARFNWKR